MCVGIVDAQVEVLVQLNSDCIFFRDLATGTVDEDPVGGISRRYREQARAYGYTGEKSQLQTVTF